MFPQAHRRSPPKPKTREACLIHQPVSSWRVGVGCRDGCDCAEVSLREIPPRPVLLLSSLMGHPNSSIHSGLHSVPGRPVPCPHHSQGVGSYTWNPSPSGGRWTRMPRLALPHLLSTPISPPTWDQSGARHFVGLSVPVRKHK